MSELVDFRILGFRAVDVGATVGVAKWYSDTYNASFIRTLLILWAVGEGLHLAFKVKTPITSIFQPVVLR